jgi:hypothetical protein
MEKENIKRTEEYKKDETIEDYLSFANGEFAKIADGARVVGEEPGLPVFFVVSTPRAGGTLFMQILCRYFSFTYPDNIVARFWESPHIGVIVSRSLREQFKDINTNDYVSDYGVTNNSVFEPHEFGNFWTKWFDFSSTHQLSDQQLAKVDVKGLKRALFLMEFFGGRPLLFKVVPLSLNVDFLASIFPNSLFLYIRRDPLFTVQSTYYGRIKIYNNENLWWSLKPKQYYELKKLKPVDQVTGQIYHSKKRIEECLKKIPKNRKITVEYESLCEKPRDVIAHIESFFGKGILKQCGEIPKKFPNMNKRNLSEKQFDEFKESLKSFKDNEGS